MSETNPDLPRFITVNGEIWPYLCAWTYRNPDGSAFFWKARYDEPEPEDPGKPKKQFRQFHHDKNGKLIHKQPRRKLVPLKADVLSSDADKPVFLVEGEKCATCPAAIGLEERGYIVTTLEGVPSKTDLHLLKNRDGYYLPDKDSSGYKRALEIVAALPGIKVLQPLSEWGEKESIDDYDDLNIMDFLTYAETSTGLLVDDLIELSGGTVDRGRNEPFLYLGFDDKAHYFIPHDQNIPLRILRGNSSLRNNIEEIASTSWWVKSFLKKSEHGAVRIDYDSAIEHVRFESIKRGIFDSSSLLGVGPHRDGDQIIINTGKSLLIYQNGEIEYNDYVGELAFVRSKYRFEIKGNPWKLEERRSFIEQINTFGFEQAIQKVALVGWCVTAPFSSLFDYRPHIWITAKKGTGKSTLMERVIEASIGPFLTKVEGKTSEAGIRQTVGRDSRPVLIDEFEFNNKTERASISNILSLARSAYGGGEIIKGSPSHEAIVFKTKMTFCFSSIKTHFTNAADVSRIVVINMTESPGRMATMPIMEGLRKMMFDRLYDLIVNIKIAKLEIMEHGHDERVGDTYAPLLAGYWMVISDTVFMADDRFNERMGELIDQIGTEPRLEDDQTVLDHLLAHQIRISPSETKTIAEMLTLFEDMPVNGERILRADSGLRRIGIRRMKKLINGETREVLAISSNHQEIKNIMEDTSFYEYKEVLSRHPAFIHGEKAKFEAVHMAGKTDRAILLDWAMIEKEFMTIPEGDDGIPF